MNSTVHYRPRHAAVPAAVESATDAFPIIPPQRRGSTTAVPATPFADRPALPVQPPHPATATRPPLPPAGLPVGHPPVPRRRVTTATVLVVASTLAALGLAAAIGIGIGSPGADGTDGTDGTDGMAHPDSSTPSPQQQLVRWRDNGGSTRLQAIQRDLDAAGQAGQEEDTTALGTACSSLQGDVESAQAYAPIPDVPAQASWASALAHGARAATYCIGGTDETSAPMIERAATELGDMTADLNTTADRIGAINGR